jgi:hypothetical protein
MKGVNPMEACNSEIRITFSLPELELIRRAVERFGHVEAEERPSPACSDHVQNVNRVLNKIVPLNPAFKGEGFLPKMTQKPETGKPLMDGTVFDGYLFSRRELEEIL